MPKPFWRNAVDVLRSTPLHPQWLLGSKNRTVRWIGQESKGVVLDIGSADSWVKSKLSENCTYIALDYPATGADLYGATPDIFATASSLPIQSGSVDTVLMLEVLEHLEHPARALSEASRALKSGGHLLLTIPFLYPIHDAPHDYQRLTFHGLSRDLKASGLANASIVASLHSAKTAGLLISLALAGACLEACTRKSVSVLMIPALLALIPLVNLAAWSLAFLTPSWEPMTAGYILQATKE